ncbi:uncharacterized protein LOC131929300 isoform X2 [Physella acuta]|uniref:uncharacterized protein LOC131929300 isoform X2 n=1 Tax=Physella acuta TaxID=109671 RepID=UPI0027DDF8FE|nr:uncharacterized protein LOC131929300 isoform X2 [Physella acuta]
MECYTLSRPPDHPTHRFVVPFLDFPLNHSAASYMPGDGIRALFDYEKLIKREQRGSGDTGELEKRQEPPRVLGRPQTAVVHYLSQYTVRRRFTLQEPAQTPGQASHAPTKRSKPVNVCQIPKIFTPKHQRRPKSISSRKKRTAPRNDTTETDSSKTSISSSSSSHSIRDTYSRIYRRHKTKTASDVSKFLKTQNTFSIAVDGRRTSKDLRAADKEDMLKKHNVYQDETKSLERRKHDNPKKTNPVLHNGLPQLCNKSRHSSVSSGSRTDQTTSQDEPLPKLRLKPSDTLTPPEVSKNAANILEARRLKKMTRYLPSMLADLNIDKLTSNTTPTHTPISSERFNSLTGFHPEQTLNSESLYFSCFPLLISGGNENKLFKKSTKIRHVTNLGFMPTRQADADRKDEVKVATSRSASTQNARPLKEQILEKYQTSGATDDDQAAMLQNLRRALDVPVTSLQHITKAAENSFPNVWQGIIKYRADPEPDSPPLSYETTDESKAEVEVTESTTQTSRPTSGYNLNFGSGEKNDPCRRLNARTETRLAALECDNKKKKKRNKKRNKNGTEIISNEFREIFYPPYSLHHFQSDATNNDVNYEHISIEVKKRNNSKVQYGYVYIPEQIVLGNYHQDAGSVIKKNSVLPRGIFLTETIPDEIRQECSLKGYELLRCLVRGKSHEHSQIFLASNNGNSTFSPVMLLHRFCTSSMVYQVTEHFPWPTLSHLISSSSKGWVGPVRRGLEEEARRSIFKQICEGMGHLHMLGIVHGDLNCGNILVTDKLQVKLTGYGPSCQRIMMSYDQMKGKFRMRAEPYDIYTPPELLGRGETWTRSCDVWSMGIVLLEMTMGEIPSTINAAVRLSGSIKKIERIGLESCGYQLSILIDKILQPRPSQRPSVWSLSHHAWLSDGTDLAKELGRETKKGIKRIDGSTFPLPKRVQNLDMPTPDAFYACSESDGDPVDEYGNFYLEVNSSTELRHNMARMLGPVDQREYSRVGWKFSQRKSTGYETGEPFPPSGLITSVDGCVDHTAGGKSPRVEDAEKSGEKSPDRLFTRRKVGKCFLSKLVDSFDCLQSSSPESDSIKLAPPEIDDPHGEYTRTTLAPNTSNHVPDVPHSSTDVTTTTDGNVYYIDRFGESVYDHRGVQCEFVLEDDERALEEMENLIKREETSFWGQDSLDIGDASGDVFAAL